jgi:hypothetical protein
MSSSPLRGIPYYWKIPDYPSRGFPSLPVPPLGQVLADLLTLPGREGEAEQLMDSLADNDPTWIE